MTTDVRLTSGLTRTFIFILCMAGVHFFWKKNRKKFERGQEEILSGVESVGPTHKNALVL